MLYLFFFSMLMFPTVYQIPRGILLIFLVLRIKRINIKEIHPKIFILWAINAFFSLFYIFHGLIRNNPGATTTVTVELLWPFLYILMMMNCHSINILIKIFKVIILGGIVINILNIVFLANEIYIGNGLLSSFSSNLGCQYGIYDGFTEFFSPSSDFAPYFLYFGCTLLLVPHNFLDIKNKYIVLLVITSLCSILFSGRRASWLMVAIMPALMLIILKLVKLDRGLISKLLIMLVPIAIVLYLSLHYILDGEVLINEFATIFDMINNDSNYERTMQAKSLWNDFLNSPLLGYGSGFVSNYIRTPEKPWEYELSYNYMLSTRGVLGTSIIFLSYLSIIYINMKKVKHNTDIAGYVLPPIMGIMCLTIMNATNPYLNKFDFLWIFFLPIITYNFLYYNNETNSNKNSNITLH